MGGLDIAGLSPGAPDSSPEPAPGLSPIQLELCGGVVETRPSLPALPPSLPLAMEKTSKGSVQPPSRSQWESFQPRATWAFPGVQAEGFPSTSTSSEGCFPVGSKDRRQGCRAALGTSLPTGHLLLLLLLLCSPESDPFGTLLPALSSTLTSLLGLSLLFPSEDQRRPVTQALCMSPWAGPGAGY